MMTTASDFLAQLMESRKKNRFDFDYHAKALENAKKVTAQIKYKPNFRFWADEALGIVFLRVSYKTADIRDGKDVEISGQRALVTIKAVGFGAEKYIQEQVRELIHDGEKHEADEWLTFNGVKVFDPHSPKSLEEVLAL